MDPINEEQEPNELINEITDFLKAKDSYYSKDIAEFKRARNLAAGNGWFEKMGKTFGESRATITINPLKSHVDSTVNAFIREPFLFEGLGEEENSKINHKLSRCLRDACELGLSYFYIYHTDEGKLKYKHLPATDVIWSKTQAVAIKREKKELKEKSGSRIWGKIDSLSLAGDEKIILTYFKVKNGKCTITKLDNDEVVGQTILDLDCVPIIPVRGSEFFLTDSEPHYRGLYYIWGDIVSAINLCLTTQAHRVMAKAPLLVDSLSFNKENGQYLEALKSNEPANVYVYHGKMRVMEGEVERWIDINPPTPAPTGIDIDKLSDALNRYIGIINNGLGADIENVNRGNETAMAVLSRNRSKEDARGEILYNLNKSAKKIAELINKYYLLLGQEVPQIVVTDNLQEGIRLRQAVDMILATQALPPTERLAVISEMNAPPSILQAVQATVQSAQDPEKQALNEQVQQLTATIQQMQTENQMAQATYQSSIAQTKAQYDTRMMELEQERAIEQAKFALEQEKLNLEYAKLGLDKVVRLKEVDIKEAEAITKITT